MQTAAVKPNLTNYDQTVKVFSWDDIRNELSGLPDSKGLNIAHEAVDRYGKGARSNHIAIRWLGKQEQIREFSYRDLMLQTNRFARVLERLKIKKGDRVFSLAGRVPELYFTALGTLKHASVYCPLFAAFGPEPIFQRMSSGDAKLLVTTETLYKHKVAKLRERLPQLKQVILIDAETHREEEGIWSFQQLIQEADDQYIIPPTDPEDMALLHFTSGTTGMPKGAVHVHNAVLTHYMTGKYVLDFHPEDIYWCTADPGWVTGTSYGILSPLLHGITNIVDEAEFDAERWYKTLETHKVNVWYTAPTAIRRLMRMNINPLEKYDLNSLRVIYSVGEPLNPEAIHWAKEKLGMPIYDNWWQTETGGIMIANFSSMEIKPGSMGKPLPGIDVAIIREDDQGHKQIITDPNMDGELALKKGWPSMFRGYLHKEEKYKKSFSGEWYLTGDLARRDEEGYYWFVGRADDIIKTSGHMVGPFEVESALIEHSAVAEAGVIGIPHELTGQMVKAFVSLNQGYEGDEKLKLELIGFGRKRLGSAVAPKEIEFVDHLPKTRSGKIMRRLLKARELGLPEGDTSTLEN